MPATDAPYLAADAVNDARRLLGMAEQHAPFSAEAAGALRDVADAYTRLAAVLARPEPGDKDHVCEWRTVAQRALREREQETERADAAEVKLAETSEEMFRLGDLLAKQCDRIAAAEAAGHPVPGLRYRDRHGEKWTVGTNGLMHHHSYSQRSYGDLLSEYGPLRRVD